MKGEKKWTFGRVEIEADVKDCVGIGLFCCIAVVEPFGCWTFGCWTVGCWTVGCWSFGCWPTLNDPDCCSCMGLSVLRTLGYCQMGLKPVDTRNFVGILEPFLKPSACIRRYSCVESCLRVILSHELSFRQVFSQKSLSKFINNNNDINFQNKK